MSGTVDDLIESLKVMSKEGYGNLTVHAGDGQGGMIQLSCSALTRTTDDSGYPEWGEVLEFPIGTNYRS